jgi:hypothetical protein
LARSAGGIVFSETVESAEASVCEAEAGGQEANEDGDRPRGFVKTIPPVGRANLRHHHVRK